VRRRGEGKMQQREGYKGFSWKGKAGEKEQEKEARIRSLHCTYFRVHKGGHNDKARRAAEEGEDKRRQLQWKKSRAVGGGKWD
jgi:uncharacterized membrane-anchored protein